VKPTHLWLTFGAINLALAVIVAVMLLARYEPPAWTASIAFLPFFFTLYTGIAGLVVGIRRYRKGAGRAWLLVAALNGLAFAILFAFFLTHFPAGSGPQAGG